jgi:hypothetical protein
VLAFSSGQLGGGELVGQPRGVHARGGDDPLHQVFENMVQGVFVVGAGLGGGAGQLALDLAAFAEDRPVVAKAIGQVRAETQLQMSRGGELDEVRVAFAPEQGVPDIERLELVHAAGGLYRFSSIRRATRAPQPTKRRRRGGKELT